LRRLRFLTSPSGITIWLPNHPGRPARWNIEPAGSDGRPRRPHGQL